MRGVLILGAVLLMTAGAFAAGADLKSIVDPYVRIQQSLNKDTVEGISTEAQSIASEAAKLGSGGEAIGAAADQVRQAADLDAARAAFGALGNAIIIYAKETGTPIGDDVKVAYCPMYRKYWLQKGDKIQNPYFGQKMPECGRLNATLPDLKK